MTQDPDLEARLRHFGEVVRTQVHVSPNLHARFMEPLESGAGMQRHRLVAQVAAAAAMLLVAVGAVALLLRVRADQLAKHTPAIKSVVPPDGSISVPLEGEFRVTFSQRPQRQPSLTYAPSDGHHETARWDGSTLTVKYSGLRPARRYEVTVTSEYTSALGGRGRFEKRWTFTTELGPPNANSGPLIWYATAPSSGPEPQPTTDVAVDWNGTTIGILHEQGNIHQSPDGSRLLAGAGGSIIDQTGMVVGQLPTLKGGPGWSDDSKQSCRMSTASGDVPSGNGEPGWLFTGSIGTAGHRVAQLGEFGGQSAPSVVACSPSTDRAVVAEGVIMWTREVWLVRLSTGTVLYHHLYADGQVASLVIASHDGRYLAEQLIMSSSQGPVVYGDTQIRRTSDGAVLARIPRQAVVGFSWDGSRVVTTPAYQSGGPNEVRVVDWQHNQVLWRHSLAPQDQTGYGRVDLLPRPEGTDIAIAVGRSTTDGTPDQYEGLWIIRGDGDSQQIVVGQLAPAF